MKKEEAYEQLDFIKKVIDETRKSFRYNGIDFIMWGILVFFGLISTYYSIITENWEIVPANWFLLVGIGILINIILFFRKKNREISKTRLGIISNKLWFAVFINMIILGFIAPSLNVYNGVYISPLIALNLGIAYYVSGILFDYKFITNLAYGWWLGALYMFKFPGKECLLIMAFMMMAFQVIPGIILLLKSTKTDE